MATANGTAFYDGEPVAPCATNFSTTTRVTGLDIFAGPVTFSVGLTGVVLDVLAILVLANQRPRTSTSFILAALSLSDAFEILQLLLGSASGPLGQIFHKFIYKSRLNPYAHYAMRNIWWTHALGQMAVLFNRGILIILATERWIAVCFPLKAASLCTRRRAVQAILVWALISILFNINKFFEYEISYCFDMKHKEIRWDLDNVSHPHYQWIMKTFWPILMALIPFIVLLVMNIMIVKTLLSSQTVHKDAASQHARQKQETARRNITIMSILICCLFIILMIPYIVIRVYQTVKMAALKAKIERINAGSGEVRSRDDLPNLWVMHASVLCLILNNSLNFVIYCCMSTRFRNSFKRTFGLQNLAKRLNRPAVASDKTGGASLITRTTILSRYDYFRRNASESPGTRQDRESVQLEPFKTMSIEDGVDENAREEQETDVLS